MKTKFFFHYNKPASKAAGCPKMSVHWKGKCHIVDSIMVAEFCWTKHRKRQPHCVMEGLCHKVNIFTTKQGSRAIIESAF